jgi:hypothetical protein
MGSLLAQMAQASFKLRQFQGDHLSRFDAPHLTAN